MQTEIRRFFNYWNCWEKKSSKFYQRIDGGHKTSLIMVGLCRWKMTVNVTSQVVWESQPDVSLIIFEASKFLWTLVEPIERMRSYISFMRKTKNYLPSPEEVFTMSRVDLFSEVQFNINVDMVI